VDTAAFDYDLPDGRIAQHPVEPRDSARLLVDLGPALDDGSRPAIDHRRVAELPDLLDPDDLLVVNTTRVLPARLHLVKRDTGGQAEVLLLERRPDLGAACWEALVRPGSRLAPGTVLVDPGAAVGLTVEVGAALDDGVRLVEVAAEGEVLAAIGAAGEMPLPPYIKAPLTDPDRYQTVYSDPDHADSSAAPTAGLHLTSAVLDAVAARGVRTATVDLTVGLGTFRPITAERIEDHPMHAERYRIAPEVIDACRATAERGGRVVAVGTTTVRALESAAATGALEGHTDLFIHGDFEFRLVDRLMTNFHQPRSSLLVMIDAFTGPRWRDLYAEALASDYRFLSFGDAMLLTRHDRWPSPA
jgi:S-adenosylmethionine:tRNA ribosyltransferase-isomerase